MKDIDICLERARHTMSGTMPEESSDAACAGTACHAAFELDLYAKRDEGQGYSLALLTAFAQEEFTVLAADPSFRYVKRNEMQARRFINNVMRTWYNEVRPWLTPEEMEVTFGPLKLYEDAERVIEMTGTIDYVDAQYGLLDWKTSGRPYEKWEKARWDLQSTTYAWAARELGIYELADVYPFEFIVLYEHRADEAKLQRVPVFRHEGDFNWLRERAKDVALLIEAELPSWPKNDNHALCSPSWCPVWSQCKGKNYAEGWPKDSRPA